MSYRLAISRCPECDGEPEGVIMRLYAVAQLGPSSHGTYWYSGYTAVDWDTQATLPLDDGCSLRVICAGRHEWESPFELLDDLDAG